jgi:hypothetical protein
MLLRGLQHFCDTLVAAPSVIASCALHVQPRLIIMVMVLLFLLWMLVLWFHLRFGRLRQGIPAYAVTDVPAVLKLQHCSCACMANRLICCEQININCCICALPSEVLVACVWCVPVLCAGCMKHVRGEHRLIHSACSLSRAAQQQHPTGISRRSIWASWFKG